MRYEVEMLLLAGLMGIVGVGAASIAVVQMQGNADVEVLPEDEEPNLEDTRNLLDDITGPEAPGDPGAWKTDAITLDEAGNAGHEHLSLKEDSDPISTDAGDNLIFSEFENDMLEQSHVESALVDGQRGNPGHDLLSVIVSDPIGGGVLSHDHQATGFGEDETSDMADAQERIVLGDWVTQRQPSEVLDYARDADSLMLVWDDLGEGAEEPDVKVSSDPYDPEVMHIVMNGQSVAEIYGEPGLTASDVTIIPLSSALIVGLEPA